MCTDGESNQARVYRTDDAVTATNASFTDLTALQQASSAPNQTLNYCGDPAVGGAQCWYDNVVYSPPGKPDVVYLGGSFSYSTYGCRNNGRAFLRSTNAGVSFTDMTWDATTNPTPAGSCCQPNAIAPNGMHPDSHAVVELPVRTPRSSARTAGSFARAERSRTSRPSARPAGCRATSLATCQQLLSAVPSNIYSLNKGLSTLQFQSLSVAADNPNHLQGGTQDNGTFETYGSAVTWPQMIYGDGGQSGFSAGNSALRFNTFTGQAHDVNFQNGDPTKWVIVGGPIAASPEGAQFYSPIIADPNPAARDDLRRVAERLADAGLGRRPGVPRSELPRVHDVAANPACGDFVRIGPAGATDLTASAADYRGTTRAGGNVAAIERAREQHRHAVGRDDDGSRLHLQERRRAAGCGDVHADRHARRERPGRFVSGIYVDPANPNHAWISYSGYSFAHAGAARPRVLGDLQPAGPSATWTNLDGRATAFPDFPATDVVDESNGDLYVSNDFGVLGSRRLDRLGSRRRRPAPGRGRGLTIVPGARKLYAATHGRSAWQLTFPSASRYGNSGRAASGRLFH